MNNSDIVILDGDDEHIDEESSYTKKKHKSKKSKHHTGKSGFKNKEGQTTMFSYFRNHI